MYYHTECLANDYRHRHRDRTSPPLSATRLELLSTDRKLMSNRKTSFEKQIDLHFLDIGLDEFLLTQKEDQEDRVYYEGENISLWQHTEDRACLEKLSVPLVTGGSKNETPAAPTKIAASTGTAALTFVTVSTSTADLALWGRLQQNREI